MKFLKIISGPRLKNVAIILLPLLLIVATQAMAQLSGYSSYNRLAVDNTKVSGTSDLTNFPVLVDITDNSLRTTANGGKVTNSNGYDIRFTAADGTTLLNHQLESYNPATGRVVAWVQLPTLKANTDTYFYIHYGNSAINSSQSSAATWDTNYKVVLHFLGSLKDGTSNGNNATNNGTALTANAKIGSGRVFNNSDFLQIADNASLDITGDITISAWINTNNGLFTTADLITKGTQAQAYTSYLSLGWRLNFTTNGSNALATNWFAITTGNWYYLTFTKNSSGRTIYINGTASRSDTNNNSFSTNNNPLNISSPTYPFNGTMDEVRVSDTARSADWIATEYTNQNAPTSFVSIVNAPPVLANIETEGISYLAGSPPQTLTSTLTVDDDDNTNLTNAYVQISSGYQSGEDVLAFTNQNGITGSWDSGSGLLTLSGTASLANYQAAIRSITYENTSGTPSQSMRTISFNVNDGSDLSNTLQRTLTVAVQITDPSTDIPNVVFHFDAEDVNGDLQTNNQPPDNSAVNSWGDRSNAATSGSSPDLSFNITSSPPVFSSQFMGERGGILFDGANNILQGPNDNLLNTPSSPFTQKSFAIVFRTSADVSSTQVLYEQGGGTRGYNIVLKSGKLYAMAYNRNGWQTGDQYKALDFGAVQPNTSYTLIVSHNATFGTGNSNDYWAGGVNNGALQILYSADPMQAHSGGPAIGQQDGNTRDPESPYPTINNTPFKGTVAELISWNTSLSPGQYSSLYEYLRAKWENMPPVLANIENTALTYHEGDPATAITSSLTVSDTDNNYMDSARVAITANFNASEDILAFSNTPAISGSYNPLTGVLTLTGRDTKANYQAALRSVTYQNSNNSAPSAASRTVQFTVYDWDDAGNTLSRNINISEVNAAPTLANIEGNALNYTEGDGGKILTAALTINDVDDSNLESATIQITGNYIQGEDVLAFTNQNGISGSFQSSTGKMVLTGSASIANYQAALRSVTYENNSPNPVTQNRTVTFIVNDGDANSNSQTRDISITAINSAPVLSDIENNALVYGAGDPPTPVTDSLVVNDFDNSNIQSATVQITGNYNNSQDVLAFSDIFGISGSWDQSSGTLTLNGNASVADYQAALRTVTYENTSSDPSGPQRTLSFTVNDGSLNSNILTRNLTVSIAGSISGLELWLKADAGTFQSAGGIAANNNGQNVGEWKDQSGNNHDFSTTATRPKLRTGVGALNNQRAVEFAGTGDFLEDSDGENYINGLSSFTLFVVIKSDQTNTDRGFWNTQVPDGEDDIFTVRYDANGANANATNLVKTGILNNSPANQLESFSNIQTTNGQIVMLQWDSGNLYDLFIDGVLNNPSGAGTPPTGTISAATLAMVGKGAKDSPDVANQSWDGLIAEVILYNRDLSQAERKSVEDYLSDKYDIKIRLITPATGGEAISADDANTTFTTLSGPTIREEFLGKLTQGGTIVLQAPTGFEWDTGSSSPTATVSPAFGGSTNLQVSYTGRTSSEVTFTVDQASSSPNSPGKVSFGNLRIRPTAGILPNNGMITNIGTTGQGGTTNYGTLGMIAGAADSLTFSQQPSNNNANEIITPAVRVQLVDQFGNSVEQGNTSVNIALTSGTGTLSGTTTALTNALGIAEFSTLKIDQTGAKKLTASSTGLNSAESTLFNIVTAGQFTGFRIERVPSGNITPKTAGQSFNIKISAVDGNNTVDTSFNGKVSISSTGTMGTGYGTTANFTNGVLSSHTVSITSVGNVKLIATNTAGTETGESNSFPVSSGMASTSTTTIKASPTVIVNNGSSTSLITVQAKDQYGNNITTGGASVALSTTQGTLGSVTDNNNGTYTATLTSTTSQVTAIITGTINGNDIADNAQVQFAQFNAVWQSQLGNQQIASDWTLPANWNNNAVPGPGDLVLIPADPAVGNEYPVIQSNQTVGKVAIEAGADITLSGGHNLTIQGDLTGAGEVNGSNNDTLTVGGDMDISTLPIGTVQYNGSSKQTVTSPHSYTNLIINNTGDGVDVSDNVTVSGTLNLANGTLKIPSGKNLIANTKNIGSGKLAFERILTGNPGWRMISSPVATTFGDLLDGTLTQGYANAFYGTGSLPGDTLQPNVLWYDETVPGTDNQRWRAPSDANDAITAGQGLYVYVFGDVAPDPLYNDALPDTLLATGQEHEGNGTKFDFNVTYTANADTGWNFIGNPFGATLNWDAPGWTKTNIDNTIYVWDPAANSGNGEYLTWNGVTGTLGSGLIAPYQGFWVKANGPGAVLKVDKANKTTGGVFKRKQPADRYAPVLQLELGKDGLSSSMNISFTSSGKTTKDVDDSYRLLPFTDKFLELYSTLEDGTELKINNMPKTFKQRLLIPVHVGGYVDGKPLSGAFTISWLGLRNLPDEWVLTLVDNKTGKEINMLKEYSYSFEVSAAKLKGKPNYTTNSSKGHFKLKEKSLSPGRFTIRVSTQDIESALPGKIYLDQSYPNPFNSTTTIEFGLNKDVNVHLDVYDILGRKVRTLIDKRLGAGLYPVTFDGRGLASGVYFYRLRAGDITKVKKFTLIK